MPGGLQTVQSWCLYYGPVTPEALTALARHDLAVVAPHAYTRAEVARLGQLGTRVLAYVSVLEVHRIAGEAPPAEVLRLDGKPVTNESYGNWVLDPRAPGTRRRLLRLARHWLTEGYRGLFLDTIGNVEHPAFPPRLAGQLVPAAARLVAELRRRFPDCLLVQNWGLLRLLPLTAPYLDGVCWEDFPYRLIGPVPTVYSGVRALARYREQTGLRVLALNQGIRDPEERAAARAAAERCGFLWYGTSDYLHLPPAG